MLENVEEFRGWGPLDINNKPIPEKKGQEFEKWVGELKRLGYRVEWKELRARDYGAPTIRKRLFVIARCDGRPIVWPAPTHGAPDDPDVIAGRKLPWRTASEIIDWSLPCPSIFTRKRPLAENTQKRIARGIRKFVLEASDPFIVPYGNDVAASVDDLIVPTIARIGQTGSNGGNVSHMEQPLTTVTSKAEHLLVSAHMSRMFGRSTGHTLDASLGTTTGRGVSALCCAWLAKHFGGVTGVGADTPLPTITARGTQTQLVTSHLLKFKGTCRHGQSVRDPMPTVQAGGQHVAEVRAFLMKYYSTGGQLATLNNPCPTITARARMGLVTVHGEEWQIVDIGMRMLSPRELFLAQGFSPDYVIDPVYNGKPLTVTAQNAACGNSVPPVLPKVLIEANCLDESAMQAVA